MKKLSLLFLIITFAFVSCTDNSAVNTAFIKYGHKKGVTSITVPGFVVRLAARIGDLDDEERELLSSIDRVKVLSVEDRYLNEEINLHAEFYNNMNKDGRYEELLHVMNSDENVTVFGKMGDDGEVIREMIVLVGGDDNALIYLKGHFKASMLDKHINFSNPGDFLSFDF